MDVEADVDGVDVEDTEKLDDVLADRDVPLDAEYDAEGVTVTEKELELESELEEVSDGVNVVRGDDEAAAEVVVEGVTFADTDAGTDSDCVRE
jgi:hypothetical protein